MTAASTPTPMFDSDAHGKLAVFDQADLTFDGIGVRIKKKSRVDSGLQMQAGHLTRTNRSA